ncbi:MAG: hypothetical protein K6G74_01780 [Bacilli bacterium]|nr:hypothetical protein [Bacilli bacterium]
MLSIRKRAIALSTIGFMAMPFLLSCENRPSVFKKLFERNVVWSDELGKVCITVQGERHEYGFAKILINNEEVKATATFSDGNGFTGISFETESNILDPHNNFCVYGLDFKETKSEGSAVFEIRSDLKETGDPYFATNDSITLKKRAITEEELDVRYCIFNYLCTEDRRLFVYQGKETPYTGRMAGEYNSNDIELFLMDGCFFKIIEDEKTLGEGKYLSTFEGMTLLFDVYGSDVFGESLSLVWCWANAQLASFAS